MAHHKLLDPARELGLRRLANLQPKAAQAVLHVVKLRLHQLTRRQQRYLAAAQRHKSVADGDCRCQIQ